jgi:hypothetical protein
MKVYWKSFVYLQAPVLSAETEIPLRNTSSDFITVLIVQVYASGLSKRSTADGRVTDMTFAQQPIQAVLATFITRTKPFIPQGLPFRSCEGVKHFNHI